MPTNLFKKGNQAAKGHHMGRPSKSKEWKAAEDLLRTTIPKILLMTTLEVKKLLQKGPTEAETLAIKYIHEHPIATIDRFLGKVPDEIKQETKGKMVITFDPGTD